MSGAHSPGPWWWLGHDCLVCRPGGRVVLTVGAGPKGTGKGLRERGEDGLLRPMDLAGPNATLIAAAPDLLAACEDGLRVARGALEMSGIGAGEWPIRAAIEKMDAAIKKAGGA